MAAVNKVFLLGNLTRDPELRQLPSGTAVCDFSLATNRQYKTSAGEEREETLFCDCTAFGRIAEVIADYCRKGRQLFVEGRLHYETWDDAKTGAKRAKLSVIVETFQFLGPRDAEAGTPAGPDAAAAKPWRRAAENVGGQSATQSAPRGKPAAAPAGTPSAGARKGRKSVDAAAEESDHFEAAELPF